MSGKRKATRRSRNIAPEKSAMAPMGVKFHGCGTMRNTAERMIITAARMARSAKKGVDDFSWNMIRVKLPQELFPATDRGRRRNRAGRLRQGGGLRGEGRGSSRRQRRGIRRVRR